MGLVDISRSSNYSSKIYRKWIWLIYKLLRSIFNRPKKRKISENPKSLFYCLEIHFLSFSAGQIINREIIALYSVFLILDLSKRIKYKMELWFFRYSKTSENFNFWNLFKKTMSYGLQIELIWLKSFLLKFFDWVNLILWYKMDS